MILTLFDSFGNSKATIAADDSSVQEKEIQGDNLLSISFTLYEFIPIDVNDYIDYFGERYWVQEKYVPSEKNTVEWEYSIRLYGIESMIKRFLVLNNIDGANEAVFSLTAKPIDHVRLIVRNINDGMVGAMDFKVGVVDGTDNVTIDYTGKYCNDGLKELAEAVGTEYWFDGETVNLCRCEHGEELALGYDKGLTSLDRDFADNAKFYTRLFPIGSRRNIDAEKYGHTRLMLPDGAKYVDVNIEKYGIIHHYEQKAFADIYPRRVGVVSSVRQEQVKDKNGKAFTIYYFKDNDLPFDPNDYEIGGLVKRVSFQEGSELAGLGTDNEHYFEVNFNSETREFEIITIWPYDDDTQLPGGTLVPKQGDKYILWNIRMPDEYYGLAEKELRSAVDEYNRKHALDVSRYKAPTDHVWMEDTGTELFIGRRIRLESKEYFPETGYRQSRITKISRKVNMPSQMDLEISDALSTGAMAKIDDAIGEVRNYAGTLVGSINVPDIIRSWDTTKPTDTNLYSARRTHNEFISKKMNDTVHGVITFMKGIVAQAKSFFIGIHNEGDYTTSGNMSSDDFSSGADGSGYSIYKRDGNSYLEIDNLLVRKKMTVSTLEILRKKYTGGNLTLGRACGTVWKVVPYSATGVRYDFAIFVVNGRTLAVETGTNRILGDSKERLYSAGDCAYYRVYFIRSDEEIKLKNNWEVGDMARVQEYDVESRVSENFTNRNWWRLVTGVGQETVDGKECNYIDVANTLIVAYKKVDGNYEFTYGSMPIHTSRLWGFDPTLNEAGANENVPPAAGDEVVQEGNVFEDDRQNLITIDVTKESHGVSLYTNIGRDTTTAGTQFSLGKVKSRFGYIGGITDVKLTPKGYGVYTDNGYFRGEFIVSVQQGENIVEMSITDAISLYVDNVTDGLERAGILIANGTIDISGTNIIITNNGTPVAVFKDGKLKSSLIEASEIWSEIVKTKTLDAQDATFTNVNISGTLDGVSGTFDYLYRKTKTSDNRYVGFAFKPNSDTIKVYGDMEATGFSKTIDGRVYWISALSYLDRIRTHCLFAEGGVSIESQPVAVVTGEWLDGYIKGNNGFVQVVHKRLSITQVGSKSCLVVPCWERDAVLPYENKEIPLMHYGVVVFKMWGGYNADAISLDMSVFQRTTIVNADTAHTVNVIRDGGVYNGTLAAGRGVDVLQLDGNTTQGGSGTAGAIGNQIWIE